MPFFVLIRDAGKVERQDYAWTRMQRVRLIRGQFPTYAAAVVSAEGTIFPWGKDYAVIEAASAAEVARRGDRSAIEWRPLPTGLIRRLLFRFRRKMSA